MTNRYVLLQDVLLYLQYIDAQLSQKILKQARLQQNELEEENGVSLPEKSQTVQLGSESDHSDAESEDNLQGDYIADFVSNNT